MILGVETPHTTRPTCHKVYNKLNADVYYIMFKRVLQTHSLYIITEKIQTLYKYYQ